MSWILLTWISRYRDNLHIAISSLNIAYFIFINRPVQISTFFFNRFRQKRRKLLDKSTKEKLSKRRNKRLQSSTSTTSTLTASASNGSISTLKPTGSLSEFSVQSYHSGDPELEYDLYDCDLNNVSGIYTQSI